MGKWGRRLKTARFKTQEGERETGDLKGGVVRSSGDLVTLQRLGFAESPPGPPV